MRGFSLTLMIFVNSGGGGYWWLDHSAWNGLTVADLLFPWFMWIMGVSMAIAFKARKKQKQTRSQMLVQVATRGIKLIAIGLFLNNGTNYQQAPPAPIPPSLPPILLTSRPPSLPPVLLTLTPHPRPHLRRQALRLAPSGSSSIFRHQLRLGGHCHDPYRELGRCRGARGY